MGSRQDAPDWPEKNGLPSQLYVKAHWDWDAAGNITILAARSQMMSGFDLMRALRESGDITAAVWHTSGLYPGD